MADTDSPLKQLVSAFITNFAAWLLQAEVHDAHPLNVELPTATLAADQVFQITLADGRTLVLHIEFQGRGPATNRWSGACWSTWSAWRVRTAWTYGVW
jgi:hypothetical protein